MNSVLVPEEAASHLGAILLAFNRGISGSLLNEAEELAKLGQTMAAVLIAGTVLEYLERGPAATLVPPGQRNEINSWRRLRDQVAHGSADTLTTEHVGRMIEGVRQIIMNQKMPTDSVGPFRTQATGAASALKGKYAHVRTSSDEFIKRKREELELENRG
jgi:hypothetical protein